MFSFNVREIVIQIFVTTENWMNSGIFNQILYELILNTINLLKRNTNLH